MNALLFPETAPQAEILAGFAPVADTLFFYAIADGDPVPTSATALVPASLSEAEWTRFQSLVADLKGNEAEYFRGSLASLSARPGSSDDSAIGTLAASIRTGKAAPAPRQTEQEIVWQSMLFLKLAEMLRQEEKEIAQGLAGISAQERELFIALKGGAEEEEDGGEEEADFSAALRAVDLLSAPAIGVERLAKAWGRLYLRDPQAWGIPLLATDQPELLGLFADRYQSRTGQSPQQLCRISIPVVDGPPEPGLIEKFRGAGKNLRQLLAEIAAQERLSSETAQALALEAEALSRIIGAEPQGATRPLTIYAFEGMALRSLFADFCGRPPASPDAESPEKATGLLAILGARLSPDKD